MTLDESSLGQALGALGAEIKSVNSRLAEHIADERARDETMISAIKGINDTLSQATGAKKLLVWLLATIFAAIALAKGWIVSK